MLPSLLALALVVQQPQASDTVSAQTPYWQQQVAYDITARLDEPSGVLSGSERIAYVNRSPDTLTTFALHLHLNAFRPGSRWADADSVEGRRRFNDLQDPDFAFNHVRNVRIMGQAARAEYPFAPDSTVVRFALPRALPPGDSMTVEMEWDARPSTTPRRQGRQGRRFDFAQWYPKVVVYDRYGWNEHPLYPGGEFYGEFASFRVRLDVPEDQVVGATGVPICGDPGWEQANRNPSRPVAYRRDYYGARTPGGLAAADSAGDRCVILRNDGSVESLDAPGRKTIVWYAEDVHHFAMSLNPEYRYEGGQYGEVAVHALYQPGDESSWGDGVAVKRTETALGWLEQIFGPFAWPQITNVHRIEGGGTEFPMMMHNGSAGQGLIVHELGHNYTQGILANNEWREGWLDEGFTSFQSSWFAETHGQPSSYPGLERGLLGLSLAGMTEPTSLVSEAYRDFVSYNIMIYSRGELFFHQLRYIVGDTTMRRILRTFYDRWKLKHVDEAAFREVAEEVSGRDLSTFFGQFLHSTARYDYAIGRTERRQVGSEWETRVEVVRLDEGRIPVEVAVVANGDTSVVRIDGLAESEWATVRTAARPDAVVLDPRVRTHDWNMLNNRKRFGLPLTSTLLPPPGTDFYFHPYFSTRTRRDRMTVGLHPVAWYNDAGGVTIGLRSRDDYLGRFEQNVAVVTYGTGVGAEDEEVRKVDFHFRARNPVVLFSPKASQTFDAFRLEGRYGGRASFEWIHQPHLTFGPTYRSGATIDWVRTQDERYLDPGFYEDAGTVELRFDQGVTEQKGDWSLALSGSLGGGIAYGLGARPGATADERDGALYTRLTAEATARRDLGEGFGLGVRAFAGAVSMQGGDAVKQRQIYLAGADPYEQLSNPFLRSRGALFVQDDVHYHAPGGAGLRGFDPRLSASAAIGVNAELERALRTRPNGRLFNRVALAVFGDVAVADAPFASAGGSDVELLGDAGVGLRADHRIGETDFTTRLDLPLYVSRAGLAQDGEPGSERVRFRWTFSFQPAF